MSPGPQIGRELPDDEQAYALACAYSPIKDGPRCGAPAVWHVRLRLLGNDVAVLSCAEHVDLARQCPGGVVDEHRTADSACAMPGSIWTQVKPSQCVLDGGGLSPLPAAVRELEMAQ